MTTKVTNASAEGDRGSLAQTVIGHFATAEPARRAFVELRRGQARVSATTILVRTSGKDHEDLPLNLTDARGAITRGVLLGGVLGFVAMLLATAVGARWMSLGFDPLLITMGVLGGMAFGALGGALAGSGNPHPVLLALEKEGGVTLVVNAPDERERVFAQRVMLRWAERVEPFADAEARSAG